MPPDPPRFPCYIQPDHFQTGGYSPVVYVLTDLGNTKVYTGTRCRANTSHWRQDPPLLPPSSSFLLEMTLLYNKGICHKKEKNKQSIAMYLPQVEFLPKAYFVC